VSQKDIDTMLQSNILVKSSLQQDAGNTLADIRNANKTPLHQRGIDLLLLATPPPDIATFSKNAPASASDNRSAPSISSVISAARPRYLLWGAQDDEVKDGQSAYWEREPFGWDSTGKHKEDRFTRVVKLDTFGGPKGAKKVSNHLMIAQRLTKPCSWHQFVYAFVLPSQLPTDPPPACPPNATANPYQKGSRGQKRQALDEQNFIFQNSEQKRQKRGRFRIPRLEILPM
jgi:hypothetical protein